MGNKQEEILNAISFLKGLSEEDMNFATNQIFGFTEEKKEKCNKIIDNIEILNEKVKIEKDKSEKGKLTLEKGQELERLSREVLGIGNLYKEYENIKCDSNEIDVLLELGDLGKSVGSFLPNELKNKIIVECKNYNKRIDVTWTGKLYSLMKYKNVKVSVLFSYLPLKGKGNWDASKGLVKKLYLKDEVLIINITIEDVKEILNYKKDLSSNKYQNIVSLINSKINEIQFHTEIDDYISKHPAQ